jgi:hypothetical protein
VESTRVLDLVRCIIPYGITLTPDMTVDRNSLAHHVHDRAETSDNVVGWITQVKVIQQCSQVKRIRNKSHSLDVTYNEGDGPKP